MKKRATVTLGLVFGMALMLVALPLLGLCATAKPQGTLRVAWPSLSQEGFLPDYGDSEQGRAWALVYDYAFYKNEKTRDNIPGLALKGEYAKDAMSYTMTLRKGVPWQDAKKWGEVTADDFKFSYEKLMREGSVSLLLAIFKKQIKSIDVVDRYTVRINFNMPSPEFHEIVAQKHAPIMCKKYIETVGDEKARWEPIGSGPYRLVEHQLGSFMKLEAADTHWRIVPEFKYMEYTIVPEESTRIAMLQTKQVDMAQISPSQITEVEKTPFLKSVLRPGGYNLFVVFGGMETKADPRYKEGYHYTDPWKDIRVREAMNLAIDRRAIIKAVYQGAAMPTSVPCLLPGWENLPEIPYNPAKAQKLLAQAGYPKGFELTVIASGAWPPASELPQVMEIVAGYLEGIGLKTKILPMDKPEIFAVARDAKHVGRIYGWKDVFRDSWSGKMQQWFRVGAEYTINQDPQIIALLDDYEKEIDTKKRAAKLAKVRDWQYKNWVTIPLVQTTPVWAVNKEVVGKWPIDMAVKHENLDYVRHAKPINTFRLFEIQK